VSDTCPQCRARLPPRPGQCFDEAVRLLIRAERVRQSSGEQARVLCAQAAALLEQVLQEEPGHVQAQCQLGWCRSKLGEFDKAVEWYRKAAEQGEEQARYNLGLCYANGEGVHKDAGKAVEWFRKAAAQGTADAQCSLGVRYWHGVGVCKDILQAAEWWRKAATQGHEGAQHNLVVMGSAVNESAAADAATRRELKEAAAEKAEKAMVELLLEEEGGAAGGGGGCGGEKRKKKHK
jgi:TPR repeat protein